MPLLYNSFMISNWNPSLHAIHDVVAVDEIIPFSVVENDNNGGGGDDDVVLLLDDEVWKVVVTTG